MAPRDQAFAASVSDATDRNGAVPLRLSVEWRPAGSRLVVQRPLIPVGIRRPERRLDQREQSMIEYQFD